VQEEESSRWTRGQFSRRDLAILFACVCFFLVILAPYLFRQRELARLNACQNNLRGIGELFFKHANTDPGSRLCTGSPHRVLDGPLDQTGWVADLVKLQPNPRPTLKCAVDPVRGLRTYNDVIRLDGAKTAEHLRERGFDTNYTASWFLARMAPRISITPDTTTDDWRNNGVPYFDAAVKHNPSATHPDNCAGGGLTLRYLETSYVSMTIVPLLADANAGNAKSMSEAAWSLNPGPAKVGAKGIVHMRPDAPLKVQLDAELQGRLATATQKNGLFLQDTRGWGAPHVDRGSLVANVLMADGSVQVFRDANGDGYLNPGFITKGADGTNFPDAGFQDSTAELPPARMFNGVLLRDPYPKAHF
jgi:prepilin-type processing-associated H-X9-DG protein